jgi:hypothetical protein
MNLLNLIYRLLITKRKKLSQKNPIIVQVSVPNLGPRDLYLLLFVCTSLNVGLQIMFFQFWNQNPVVEHRN